MDDGGPLGHGWRGSEAAWIDAAYGALVEGGVDAVKVMSLARRLRMSRTSFYWHFTDREALLAALIRRWQTDTTDTLIARTRDPAATIGEAVLNLFDCWITPALFDDRLEFAMRNWSQSDPALRTLFRSADADRIDAIRAMFLRHGYAPQEADIRANTIYLTQVGYIVTQAREPLADRLQRIPVWLETFTGRPPDAGEVARFLARHTELQTERSQ